jgi:hypothetical protein
MSEERARSASEKITCKADLMALAAGLGGFQKDLFALAQAVDPFNADREGRREWAEWFAGVFTRLGIGRGALVEVRTYVASTIA